MEEDIWGKMGFSVLPQSAFKLTNLGIKLRTLQLQIPTLPPDAEPAAWDMVARYHAYIVTKKRSQLLYVRVGKVSRKI